MLYGLPKHPSIDTAHTKYCVAFQDILLIFGKLVNKFDIFVIKTLTKYCMVFGNNRLLLWHILDTA